MDAIRPHFKTIALVAGVLIVGYFLLSRPTREATVNAPASTASPAAERTYEIVTLLPKDAIPAVDNPRFLTAAEADAEYAPEELVLGVSLNGESRAYSTSYLDAHEIVNDAVGGRKIAVTW